MPNKVQHEYAGVSLVEIPGKGRGLIADRDYAIHQTIVVSPVVIIPPEEQASIFATALGKYVFNWPYSDDGAVLNAHSDRCAAVLGLGSLINHAPDPNCVWDFIPEMKLHLIKANTHIAKGEELSIDYGWTPEEFKRSQPHSALNEIETHGRDMLSDLGRELIAQAHR